MSLCIRPELDAVLNQFRLIFWIFRLALCVNHQGFHDQRNLVADPIEGMSSWRWKRSLQYTDDLGIHASAATFGKGLNPIAQPVGKAEHELV